MRLPIVILGSALISAAVYSYQHSSQSTVALAAGASNNRSIENHHKATNHREAGQSRTEIRQSYDSDFTMHEGTKPFTAADVQSHLKNFFSRFYADPPMSRAERSAFAAQLSAAIDANPETRKAVAEFYSQMPAKDAMDRDIMRNMLALSDDGRSMLLDEANRIWDSKDKSLYAHMYETYSNMPGQASRSVLANAVSSLNDRSTDTRTAVAALNFIGTIEKDDSADAGKLRSNTVSQLNSIVVGNSEEVVRGLAAQKIYRLSSPESAADAAVGFLGHAANTSLVMQTLDSINSGDVELTPPLRSALTNVVARPSASNQERERFNEVMASGHS
ncbi:MULTISPECIES: hypothetical protein [Xanthomonas]|nr:hypothetical protein [Xanthomonas cannabis]